jgi:hypothetical protein
MLACWQLHVPDQHPSSYPFLSTHSPYKVLFPCHCHCKRTHLSLEHLNANIVNCILNMLSLDMLLTLHMMLKLKKRFIPPTLVKPKLIVRVTQLISR